VVPGLDHATRVAVGATTSYALDDTGHVWAWGWNDVGQLGDGSTDPRTSPGIVPGLTDVVTIGTAFDTAFAVDGSGQLWAWGGGRWGTIGDGGTSNRLSPVRIDGPSGVTAITGDFGRVAAIDAAGQLWQWGSKGWYGAPDSLTPVHTAAPCTLAGIAVMNSAPYARLCDDDTVADAPGLDHVVAVSQAASLGSGIQALRDDGTVWVYLTDPVAGDPTGWQQIPGLDRVHYIAGYGDIAWSSTGE
jgi:hypothetical protein